MGRKVRIRCPVCDRWLRAFDSNEPVQAFVHNRKTGKGCRLIVRPSEAQAVRVPDTVRLEEALATYAQREDSLLAFLEGTISFQDFEERSEAWSRGGTHPWLDPVQRSQRGVSLLGHDPPRLRCGECGTAWEPVRTNGLAPTTWWTCPKGCNASAIRGAG